MDADIFSAWFFLLALIAVAQGFGVYVTRVVKKTRTPNLPDKFPYNNRKWYIVWIFVCFGNLLFYSLLCGLMILRLGDGSDETIYSYAALATILFYPMLNGIAYVIAKKVVAQKQENTKMR